MRQRQQVINSADSYMMIGVMQDFVELCSVFILYLGCMAYKLFCHSFRVSAGFDYSIQDFKNSLYNYELLYSYDFDLRPISYLYR